MMEGLAVKQASHAALLLEYGQPAQDAFISCLASSESRLPLQPAPDTCSSSPVDAWWHSAAMLGDWVQSSRSDHACSALVGHSRYPHGISTPTACLPASQQASQPASQPLPCPPLPPTSGMPCPATACEPRSICVVPCTPHPPFVPVVMLACQTM